MKVAFGTLALLAAHSLSGCGSAADTGMSVFSSEVTEIILEVDYAADAEPFTGGDWKLFQSNAAALFAGSPRRITVPRELFEMQLIEPAGDQDYSVDDIVELGRTYRDEPVSDTRRAFHVLFLDGYFAKDDVRQAEVLAVSLVETSIIAVFKPVVRRSGASRFVEQSTLVHEFGHLVGLVNIDLEMVSDHHDAAHGAHCTNPDCVMYYLHEGAADLTKFLRRFNETSDPVLFGQQCLDDAHAASLRER